MTPFAKDVLAGLRLSERKLSSKYFYDDAGSKLFQEIMHMPEYYLYDSEMDILTNKSGNILAATGLSGRFNVVELGAGDGVKTQQMLKAFIAAGAEPVYRPIDISAEDVNIVQERLSREMPELEVQPEIGDYFERMQAISSSDMPSLVLFLGSNLGNYVPPDNLELISTISASMKRGDQLIIGVDLRKDPNLIRQAYDDKAGITRRFNLNLLKRMNRELGADFDLEAWDFYCSYNPHNGEVRSYLVSMREQMVNIKAIDKGFGFGRHELIWTELSKKYSREELAKLGLAAGLQHKEDFLDSNDYFTDTLFIKS